MDDIFKDINTATTILTPNRRLSAWLHKDYNLRQIQAGNKTWECPDILPFNSWVNRLWDEHCYRSTEKSQLLLSPAQEHFLWETIISSMHDDALLQVSKTADLAKSAWLVLKQWLHTTNDPLFLSSEDYSAYKDWSASFSQKCSISNWIDSASLIARIIELLEKDTLAIRQNIVLCGFTELPPLMQKLFASLRVKNTTIKSINIDNNHQQHYQTSFKSQQDELIAAARWSKKISMTNPDASIGIVVPSLERSYNQVSRIFKDVFDESIHINITAGKPLSDHAIIRAAINVLNLHNAVVSQEVFSDILSSPFIGNAENEQIKRAKFDAYLRRDNIDAININVLLEVDSALNEKFTQHCPKLINQFVKWNGILREIDNKQTYGQWAVTFSSCLHAMGWPGERSLNSEEYQIVDKWFELLNELAKLDHITTTVTYKTAISTLQMLAAKQLFQAKSPDANIQIMGMLEAASIPFDYLWITGLNDITWPSQPAPNPFIPPRIQRDNNMPHATSERELEYCESMTAQFISSSKYTIFSYAHMIDNIEVSQSPIIKNFPLLSSINLADYTSTNDQIYASASIEVIEDNIGPALSSDAVTSGGVSLMKDQALCPFKAFATWRLHARSLDEPVPGLSKRERGTILHDIIENIWGKIADQKSLLSLSDHDLKMLIMNTIDTVVQASKLIQYQGKQYIELEKARLLNLVYQWLQHEKSRPPFKIDSLEKSTEISIGKLKLETRVDRVDILENDDKLLIDYKTGSSLDINNWFTDRPEEPQLPIYALNTPSIAGISYAQLYMGKMSFVGISNYDLEIDGIKPVNKIRNAESEWNKQIDKWKISLNALADEFSDGLAIVSPKNGPVTCNWCNLKPLCRYQPANGLTDNE